jgi:hypothetical protein
MPPPAAATSPRRLLDHSDVNRGADLSRKVVVCADGEYFSRARVTFPLRHLGKGRVAVSTRVRARARGEQPDGRTPPCAAASPRPDLPAGIPPGRHPPGVRRQRVRGFTLARWLTPLPDNRPPPTTCVVLREAVRGGAASRQRRSAPVKPLRPAAAPVRLVEGKVGRGCGGRGPAALATYPGSNTASSSCALPTSRSRWPGQR